MSTDTELKPTPPEAEAAPPMTRESLLEVLAPLRASLHLLQPGDIPVRMALVLHGMVTSGAFYKVNAQGVTHTFLRNGSAPEFTLAFPDRGSCEAAYLAIAKKSSGLKLYMRVIGFGTDPNAGQKPKVEPSTAPKIEDEPATDPAEEMVSYDPDCLRDNRRAELMRMPEIWVRNRYRDLPVEGVRLPPRMPKEDHVEGILDVEFPKIPKSEAQRRLAQREKPEQAGQIVRDTAPVPPPPAPPAGALTQLPAGGPPPPPCDGPGVNVPSIEDLLAMPFAEFKALAAEHQVRTVGVKREDAVEAVRAALVKAAKPEEAK